MCFNLEHLVICRSVHDAVESAQYSLSAVKHTTYCFIECVWADTYYHVDDWVIGDVKGLDVLISFGSGISHEIGAM